MAATKISTPVATSAPSASGSGAAAKKTVNVNVKGGKASKETVAAEVVELASQAAVELASPKTAKAAKAAVAAKSAAKASKGKAAEQAPPASESEAETTEPAAKSAKTSKTTKAARSTGKSAKAAAALANVDEATTTAAAAADAETAEMSLGQRVTFNMLALVVKIGGIEAVFNTELKELRLSVKALQKDLVKLQKTSAVGGKRKRVKKTDADGVEVPRRSGFQMPTAISDKLADFLHLEHGVTMPRLEVVKLIYSYIKDNNLQNPANKRNILPNKELHDILGTTDESSINYFNMQGLLKPHFTPVSPAAAAAAAAAAASTPADSAPVAADSAV